MYVMQRRISLSPTNEIRITSNQIKTDKTDKPEAGPYSWNMIMAGQKIKDKTKPN